jgi:2,5-diketo-D-gluconate reductase A
VGKLNARDCALVVDEARDPRERLEVLLAPNAEILRRNPPLRRNRRGFREHKPGSANCARSQMSEMPVVGAAVDRGILAHRRNADAIGESDVAQPKFAQQVRHGQAFEGRGCSVQLCSRLGLACKRNGDRGSRPACLALVCSHSPRHCHRAHGLASIDRARVLFANFPRQLEDGSMTIQDQPAVILNDGRSMPQFGLGVFQTPPEITADIVRKAVDVGYRAVDTAAAYRNEEGVGEALDGRPDIFVTTKLWNADHGFDEALHAFEESARKLRRHALDLYLIHWPRPRVNRYVQSWKALVRLKSEGRSQSIGVSNFNREHLERIIGETGVTPAVNQVELHPRFQQRPLRAFHVQHGIRTESWSPLGRGPLLTDPAIVGIAAKHGRTPAQVVIRWHLESGLIVIPKTVRTERLRENIGALGFRLDDDDMRRIDALDSPDGRIGPDPATAAF